MLRARSGLSQTMIGRAQPLSALADLVETARSQTVGEPAVALVSGDAGVGKTRLLAELCRQLDGGSVVVIATQAQPGSLGQPFELAEALAGPGARDPDEDAGAVVTRIARAVVDRIGDRPGVVIVEDLHWADAGSAAVLGRLLTTGRPDLVVVLSYRPDEITQRLPGGELLARVERTRQALRLHLEPLRRRDVSAFLASVYERPMTSAVVDTLLARTGGNPFFLEELLYAAGSVDPERLAAQPLPWSLADLVANQLEGLSVDERSIVEALAVLGNRGPFNVLQIVTAHDEEPLVRLLRALVHRGLLVEDGDDDFSFRHALVRDAVLHQMLSRERRRLHASALGALRELCCTDVADLARHAAGAGLWDELVALARDGVPYYLARGSSHQALRLATEALAEAPDDVDLLAGAARAAWLLGFGVEALTHAHRWQTVSRAAGSLDQQAAAARLLARLYHEQNDERLWPHVAHLESLLATLPDGVERARVLAALAQAEMLAHHDEVAVRWGQAAIEAAEAAGAKDVLAQAKIETGSALVSDDHVGDGEQTLRDGVAEAEAIGDWVLVARGLNNLISYHPVGDPGIPALVARIEQVAERAGFDMNRLLACERLAEYAVAIGDRELAVAEVERLDEAERVMSSTRHTTEPLRALLEGEAGRTELAVALATRAAPPDDPAHWADWDMPGIAALAGDAGPALDALRRAGERPRLGRLQRHPSQLHEYTAWAVHAGATGSDIVAAAGPLLDDERPVVVEAVRGVRAEMAFADDRHGEVIALLHDRFDADGTASPDRRHAARLRVLLARSLAANGRRVDALAVARAAATDLERWPGFRLDEVERLVTRLAGSSGGDGTLTGRELEVAALVAEGLTNAELARRLFISPKTAAVHVSNIFTKLGLANRAELATWFTRQLAAHD